MFESFLAEGNATLVAFLEDIAETGNGPGAWISGSSATGKTHLLQALSARVGDLDVVGAEAPVSYLNVVGGYICTGRLSEFSYESIETFNVAVDFEAG